MRVNDIRWIGFAVGVGLVLSILPAAARMDVKVEFDKTFDFKTIRTWGWRASGPGDVKMARTQQDDPESIRRQAEPILVDAVTTQIARRGLQPATADPDLIVTYYLLLTTSMSAQTLGQFLPADGGGACRPSNKPAQSLTMMNRGSLVLDLSAKGNVVWRASLRPTSSSTPTPKSESLLQEAVRDLLAKYPPKG
jgi:hypothetical protein